MGAVDDLLREHKVLHTTTGCYDPNAISLVEERGLVLENVVCDVSCTKRMHRCVCGHAAEHANEIFNHKKRKVPGRWNQLCWRDAPFSRQAVWPSWGCLAFPIKLEHPTVR